MKIGDYETHPIADAFPLLQGEEFERLKQDIKDNGLVDRELVTFKGKLLDGRNRLRACLELGKAIGTKPKFREHDGDPIALVMSANYHRRQMTISQRAIVACRLAELRQGRPKTRNVAGYLTQAAAAQLLGVSERAVQDARTVLDKGVAELVAAVDRGDLTVNAALAIAEYPHERQLELLNKALTGGNNRRARSNIVRQNTRRDDDAQDTVMVLARAAVRCVTTLGGSVKQGAAVERDGRTESVELLVGFQGKQLTLTIATDDPEPA